MLPAEDLKVNKEQYNTDGMICLLYYLSIQNPVVLCKETYMFLSCSGRGTKTNTGERNNEEPSSKQRIKVWGF